MCRTMVYLFTSIVASYDMVGWMSAVVRSYGYGPRCCDAVRSVVEQGVVMLINLKVKSQRKRANNRER